MNFPNTAFLSAKSKVVLQRCLKEYLSKAFTVFARSHRIDDSLQFAVDRMHGRRCGEQDLLVLTSLEDGIQFDGETMFSDANCAWKMENCEAMPRSEALDLTGLNEETKLSEANFYRSYSCKFGKKTAGS